MFNIKKVFSRKLVVILILAVIIIGFFGYRFFNKNGKENFSLEKVSKGTVIREVSETGTVKVSEKSSLSFKNSGRIEKIFVKVGEKVEAGKELASLDLTQFNLELSSARADLVIAQADYDKLLSGPSEEEISVARAAVNNSQVAFDNAKQSLEDVKAGADLNLKNAYEDSLAVLDDAYLKTYNAYNFVVLLHKTYFSTTDQEGVMITESRETMSGVVSRMKILLDSAKTSNSTFRIDEALSGFDVDLSKAISATEIIRSAIEGAKYAGVVSSADKASLDTHRSYIISSQSSVVGSRQNISSVKINNRTSINSSQAQVNIADSQLQKAKEDFALKVAKPRQEDVDLKLGRVRQAQAQVLISQNKIQDSILRAPIGGQIADINRKEGEIIQPNEWMISFLPSSPFQIEVNIYEEDIIDVRVGSIVKISLPAFPDSILSGRVSSIDPSEIVSGGVVYYKVMIDFEDFKEGIKPGMTADIVIEGNKKENVLFVSKNAVRKTDGKRFVRVLENNNAVEKEIIVGLEGNESFEIISGLKEGEEVILD